MFKEQWDQLTEIQNRLTGNRNAPVRPLDFHRLIDVTIALLCHVAQQHRRILDLQGKSTTPPAKPEPTLQAIHRWRVFLSNSRYCEVEAPDEHTARLQANLRQAPGTVANEIYQLPD